MNKVLSFATAVFCFLGLITLTAESFHIDRDGKIFYPNSYKILGMHNTPTQYWGTYTDSHHVADNVDELHDLLKNFGLYRDRELGRGALAVSKGLTMPAVFELRNIVNYRVISFEELKEVEIKRIDEAGLLGEEFTYHVGLLSMEELSRKRTKKRKLVTVARDIFTVIHSDEDLKKTLKRFRKLGIQLSPEKVKEMADIKRAQYPFGLKINSDVQHRWVDMGTRIKLRTTIPSNIPAASCKVVVNDVFGHVTDPSAKKKVKKLRSVMLYRDDRGVLSEPSY